MDVRERRQMMMSARTDGRRQAVVSLARAVSWRVASLATAPASLPRSRVAALIELFCSVDDQLSCHTPQIDGRTDGRFTGPFLHRTAKIRPTNHQGDIKRQFHLAPRLL